MDAAFLRLRTALLELLQPFEADMSDADAGVRLTLTECEIETPLELSVAKNAEGKLAVGVSPPMYHVDTTFKPSYHRVRLTASRD